MEKNKKHMKLSTVSKNILIPLIPPAVVASIVAPIAIVYNKKSVEQEKWIVTFDENFGDSTSTVSERKVTKGETTTLYNPEHRDGHGFLGWKTVKDDGSEAAEEAEYFDFANTPITGNITLYGWWQHEAIPATLMESLFDFEVSKGKATISIQEGVTLPENLVIPSTVEITNENGNKEVTVITSVKKHGFMKARHVRSISLPDTITSIGEFAFGYNNTLQILNMPKSLTKIDKHAFIACPNLEEITLPEGMINIDEKAFAGDGDYDEATGEWTYADYTYIRKLTLPSTIINIETYAFAYSYIEKIDLSNTHITSIANYAMFYAVGTKEVLLPDTLTDIGQYSFAYNWHLHSINIPTRVQTIKYGAFQNCWSLTDINFADDSMLYSIMDYAFENCYCLSKLTMPEFISYIGPMAFKNTNLISVKFKTIKAWRNKISDSWKPSSTDYEQNAYDLWYATSYINPDDGTEQGIRMVDYGTTVSTEDYTVSYLSNGVDRCVIISFTPVNAKITIPATITERGKQAKTLKVVGIDTNTLSKSPAPVSVTEIEFLQDENGQNYIEYIRNNAFRKFNYINKVNFEVLTNLQYLEEGAFQDCFSTETETTEGTVSIDLTKCTNLKYVGPYAFWKTMGNGLYSTIKDIQLPSSVETIGSGAFSGLENLTSINFENLSNLSYLEYEQYQDELYETEYYFDSLVYGSKIEKIDLSATQLTYLPECAFYYAYKATNIVLPKKLKYLGTQAFEECYALANISLPDTLTYIGAKAFYDCNSLETITIPSNCTYIGPMAFYVSDGEASLSKVIFNDKSKKWYLYYGNDTIEYQVDDDAKNAQYMLDNNYSDYSWIKASE